MIIKEITKDIDYDGYLEGLNWSLLINGEEKMRISNLCEYPEDATLNRDLGFVYSIMPLLKKVYEIGKNGAEIKFETETNVEEGEY